MKIRPLVKIVGGKYYLSKFIVANFPKEYEEMNYLEPFGGGGSVILNKRKSVTDHYNDLDKKLTSIFYYLKNCPEITIERINKIDYNKDSFLWSLQDHKDDFDKAVAELVSRRMSRCGFKKNYCWSKRLRGGQWGELNSWQTFKQQLPMIVDRLKEINISSEDAMQLISRCTEDFVIYCDPPYQPSVRQASLYEVEMTEYQHIVLSDILTKSKSKIILSGYQSVLYSKLYKDWRLVTKDMPNHSSQAKEKERRVECLWMNY